MDQRRPPSGPVLAGLLLFGAGVLVGWWLGSGERRETVGPPVPRVRPESPAIPAASPPPADPAAPTPEPPPPAAPEHAPEIPPATPEAEAAIPAPAAAPAAGPPRYTLPERLQGKVMDALGRKPVAGVQVELRWELPDGTLSSGEGIDVAEDGSFELDARAEIRSRIENLLRPDEQPEADSFATAFRAHYRTVDEAMEELEYTLRVTAPGYDPYEMGQPRAAGTIRLNPATAALPGAVRVDARWPDDGRYDGRLLVDFLTSDSGSFSQWALPESDGTHLCAGVPSGNWNVRTSGKSDSGSRIQVPEVGEVRVRLRVSGKGVREPEGVPAGAPREVRVSCGSRLPGANSFVRAEARPGVFWRSEVVAGAATFAALPAGKWEFVLQEPDRPEVRLAAEVPEGETRLDLGIPQPLDGR